ncbi:MAG: hypothetical protein ACRED5_18265, partial [Propylenella sp.]
MKAMASGIGVTVAAAIAGGAASAAIYFVVLGVASLLGAADGSETPVLAWRAWTFGATFGLLSGAHWGLAAARRVLADEPQAMIPAKGLTVALVVLGIALAVTGGRWGAM